jgi:hypothetical protein
MTDDDKPPPRLYGVHARLHPPPNEVARAVADYKARQEAQRGNMAKLRELQLAAEAKAASGPKVKQKPGGKAKRP